MSHNTIIKVGAGLIVIASLSGAYYVGSKRPGPEPKVIVIEKPVIIEKRVEVPVPAKTTVTAPTRSTVTPTPTTTTTTKPAN